MNTRLLIAGGGAAGLAAALAGAEAGLEPVVLDDAGFRHGASVQAQGGFSAVTPAGVAAGDSVASHVADTLVAGAGHGDPAIVAAVCAAAREHVRTLTRWGTAWDGDASGAPALTREAAHSFARILHCGGDASGAGIVAALRTRLRQLQEQGRVRVLDSARITRLLMGDGAVRGAEVCLAGSGISSAEAYTVRVDAGAVLLATGGISGVYGTRTSRWANPGDAAALAWRVGAVLADAEMVQFHPTHCPQAGFMLTEALRGEGAVLRDAAGRRFMQELDPRAELAPRDVVARGVAGAEGGAWLDAAPILQREGRGYLARRFPTVTAALAAAGLDLEAAPVPVAPAEHYWMGGVAVDAAARSTVPGLLVAGEAARTGLHGANRLASNSLLEAVHTGLAAVATVRAGRHTEPGAPVLDAHRVSAVAAVPTLDGVAPGGVSTGASTAPGNTTLTGGSSAIQGGRGTSRRRPSVERIGTLADEHLGVGRDERGLRMMLAELGPEHPEEPSEATVARLVATAALARTASLGAHARTDAMPGEPALPGATVALQRSRSASSHQTPPAGQARTGVEHAASGTHQATLQEVPA